MNSLQHVGHLEPHLAGGVVVESLLGVLAGSLLDAGQLLVVAGGVEEEAHAAGELALGDGGGLVRGPAGPAAHGEEAEAKDEGLQDDQDQEVGQVEREDLGGGGSPGQEFVAQRQHIVHSHDADCVGELQIKRKTGSNTCSGLELSLSAQFELGTPGLEVGGSSSSAVHPSWVKCAMRAHMCTHASLSLCLTGQGKK